MARLELTVIRHDGTKKVERTALDNVMGRRSIDKAALYFMTLSEVEKCEVARLDP